MKRLPLMEKKNQWFIVFQEHKEGLSLPFIIIFVYKAKMKGNFHDKKEKYSLLPHSLNIVISFKNRIFL